MERSRRGDTGSHLRGTWARLGSAGSVGKDQDATVLSFSGDAYLNEMGVTNRLKPKDVTSVCKVTADLEDKPDNLGLADIGHLAQFIRGAQVPPCQTALAGTSDDIAGQYLFSAISCATCHVKTLTTDDPGAVIHGGAFVVPKASNRASYTTMPQ